MGTVALGCPAATVFVAAAPSVRRLVLRFPAQQLSRMWNQLRNSLQRFDRPGRTPRQIQNERLPAHAANPSAKRRKRSLLAALAPHALCHAIQEPIAYRTGGLRRDIACSDSSSAGRHDKLHLARQANQQILNLNGIVRNDLAHGNLEGKLVKYLRHRRAG